MVDAAAGVSYGEVCRLVLVGPESRVEVAVPTHVPLADLIPTLVGYFGPELAGAGHEHGGWVLQRLGESSLAEDLGTAALGLYDGDMVYLRARADQLPPVDFDDLVDGVATGITARTDRWRPELTRLVLFALVGAALAVGAAVVPATGAGTQAALFAGLAAVALLAGGAAASRAWGDGPAGALLAAGAVGFAATAGLVLPAGDRPAHPGPALLGSGLLTAPGLLAAGTAAAAAAVLARFALGGACRGFLATAGAATLVAGAGLLAAEPGVDTAGAAAITLATVLLLGVIVPILAARLAGLRIKPLPTTAAEFQQDIDAEPSQRILASTHLADGYVAALYLALGAVSAGCLAVLAATSGPAAQTLAAVVSFLLMLHGRELSGAWQRLATLVPGLFGAAAVLLARAAAATPAHRLVIVAGLVVLAAVLVAAARVLPGRRLLPYWGRVADLLHTAAAISVVPLVLAVLHLYGKVRAGWA
jgi:type VII secretion integral membrane protein EccD